MSLPSLNSQLPFLALPDGSHLREEDFSYFHLLAPELLPESTVFGISCNRQIPSEMLKVKEKEVTRSTVQKAVVILANKVLPILFLNLRHSSRLGTNSPFLPHYEIVLDF
jgi:hypothetical protein